jgi:nicotinamide mononucleotide transporter
VGVPLLLQAQLYPSALMYIVYGVFCVIGFISWLRIERRERNAGARPDGVADPVAETVG